MALTLEIGPGDVLRVGDAVIRYEYKSGNTARLHINAPAQVIVKKEPEPTKKNVAGFVPIMRK